MSANETRQIVPTEIDRAKHGFVLAVWNDCMAKAETLEMTWPKLVRAICTSEEIAEEKKARDDGAFWPIASAGDPDLPDASAGVGLKADADRYREACADPEGFIHLLRLMVKENAGKAALDKMMDRIIESRARARASVAAKGGKS